MKIHYGPVGRICTGFFIATLGGVAYAVLQYYAYESSPCGYYGSSDPKCVDGGLTSDISVWWMGLPYSIGGKFIQKWLLIALLLIRIIGISELFINVPGKPLPWHRSTPMDSPLIAYSLWHRLLSSTKKHEGTGFSH